jgi:hypothetical protein
VTDTKDYCSVHSKHLSSTGVFSEIKMAKLCFFMPISLILLSMLVLSLKRKEQSKSCKTMSARRYLFLFYPVEVRLKNLKHKKNMNKLLP